MLVLILFAFISGLLTILAPCIWPLLPIILSATTTGGKYKPLGITLGILVSFTVFTLSLSYLVMMFHFDPDRLRLLAVVIISFLGVSLIVPRLSALVETLVSRFAARFGPIQERTGFGGGLVTGMSLGVVWSPCAGPILATIATLAATQAVSSRVILVTLAYMAGTGIPLFIFATVGKNLLTRTRVLSPYLGRIQQVFGVVMVVTALAIWTNYDKVIQAKLLDVVPAYSNFLFKLEENVRIREELSRLRGGEARKETPMKSFLPDLGPAPEIIGITNWLNSPPLTLASLKGKVVLIDFWTYTCINCIRTFPFVKGWYAGYKDQGLVVIGIHTPEFEFEKKTSNVAMALTLYQITYPVAQDNDYATWKNFKNSYWPAKYLIDKDGRLRLVHFGEGAYEEIEKAIQSLLAETGKPPPTGTLALTEETPKRAISPETYLGLARQERLVPATEKLALHRWSVSGKWHFEEEFAEASPGAELTFRFSANKVFLVLSPPETGGEIEVYLDGESVKTLKLDEERLYELIDLGGNYGEHTLKLHFKSAGVKGFAFTFG